MLDQQERRERIDRNLDRLEDRLPALPAAGLRFQRALAARSCAMANGLAKTWWGSIGETADRAGTATATVVGTGQAAAERATEAVAAAARQVVGQTEAQTRAVVDRAEQELTEAADATAQMADRAVADATRAVDAATVAADPERTPTGDAYQDLTKAELARRARALEIEGRSRMSKDELIAALLDHEQQAADERG